MAGQVSRGAPAPPERPGAPRSARRDALHRTERVFLTYSMRREQPPCCGTGPASLYLSLEVCIGKKMTNNGCRDSGTYQVDGGIKPR